MPNPPVPSPKRPAIDLQIWVNLGVCLVLVGAIWAAKTVYNTTHMGDTTLMANLGWRDLHGLKPSVDYPHLYGGVMAWLVGVSYGVFGTGLKAIDYGIVFGFIGVGIMLGAMVWRRISWTSASFLLLVIAITLLSRSPYEQTAPPLLGAAHSFSYNHLGAGIMIAVAPFALFASPNKRAEICGGLICGVGLWILALIKPTFAAYLPAVFMALFVQRRWKTAVITAVALGIASVITDFGLLRFLGAFNYLTTTTSNLTGGLSGLIEKTVILLIQSRFILALLAVFAVFLLAKPSRYIGGFCLATTLLAIGYLATAVTMGPQVALQLMPFALCLLVLSVEAILRDKDRPAQTTHIATRARDYVVWIIALPIIVNSIMISTLSHTRADLRLIQDGPLGEYFFAGDLSLTPYLPGETAQERTTRILKTAAAQPLSRYAADQSLTYVMAADAIMMLRGLPDLGQYGIVSNGIEFSALVESRPMANIPPWLSTNALAHLPSSGLPNDVDIVVLTKAHPPQWFPILEPLKSRMGDGFQLCQSSLFWDMYVRRDIATISCSPLDP